MKLNPTLILALAAFLVLPQSGKAASDATSIIELVGTFDYRAAGQISTSVGKINDQNEIVGYYSEGSGPVMGYIRYKGRNFSRPIIEPNDTANFTVLTAINNNRIAAGRYVTTPDNVFHGFLLKKGVFKTFDVSGAGSTYPQELNDAGDLAGYFYDDDSDLIQGFATVGGVTTTISIPGSSYVAATGINNLGEVVGFYLDFSSLIRGFFRDASGNMQYPIEFPGALETQIQGNNDRGDVVGIYFDDAEVGHGFFFSPPDTFLSYDYPGGTYTTLNGINNNRVISGFYKGTSGLRHGLVVRVTPHTSQ